MTSLLDLLPIAHQAANRPPSLHALARPAHSRPRATGTTRQKSTSRSSGSSATSWPSEPRTSPSWERRKNGTGVDASEWWTLDPIDGTVNFAHDVPLFAVSLALIRDQRPVLGVIDLPAMDSRYWAAQGHGAHRDGRALKVRDVDRLDDAVLAIGDYAVGPGATDKNRIRLNVTELLAGRALRVRMLGSAAIDLAWLAGGPARRQRHAVKPIVGRSGGRHHRPGSRRSRARLRRQPAHDRLGSHDRHRTRDPRRPPSTRSHRD